MSAPDLTAQPPLRVVRSSRREGPADPEVVRGLERVVIGTLLVEPSRTPSVAEVLAERHFQDPRHALVFTTWRDMYRTGVAMTLPVLRDELDKIDALVRIGGAGEIAALVDEADTPEFVVEHARRVRRLHLERHAQLLHQRAAEGIREDGDLDELVRIGAEIAGLDGPTTAEEIGVSGDALRNVTAEPEPPSPLPGLLDPLPSLLVVAGRPKVAKTTLGLHLALSWACGVSPWADAPALPGSRALVISAEQSLRRVSITLDRLARWHGKESREGWHDRMVVVARDRALSRESRALLRLDRAGLVLLRRTLQQAADRGGPFGFVLLDSLSRLKPPEVEENNADAMSAWLDELAALATDFGVYVPLVHHRGHEDRANPVTAPRGSTAIAAVAQVIWKIEIAEGRPWERTLTVTGNAIENTTLTLEVAPPEESGRVLYFKPADPCSGYDLDDLIPVGDALSENKIAQNLSGKAKPDGAAIRKARLLVEGWAKQGKIHRDPPLGRGKPALVRRRVDVED